MKDGCSNAFSRTIDSTKMSGFGCYSGLRQQRMLAVAETHRYLDSFDAFDIIEPGQLYFNVAWVSEEEFGKLVPA